ncbi:MAG: hypothetical protein RL557_52 [archaeon]|jgi:hypothetical protein
MTDYIVQQRGSEARGYEMRKISPAERRTSQFLRHDIFDEVLPEADAAEKYVSLNNLRSQNYEDSFYATD